MDKKRIHEMLECLTDVALSELKSKGAHSIDTEEMGKVVDMVKDLADAEKSVWEKYYYEKIVEAMKEEEELEEILYKEGRAGYDRWRTSHGRFAPKGHGHETSMHMATGRMGYDPKRYLYDDMYPWVNAPYMLGYSGDHREHERSTDWRPDGSDRVTGDATARMGYTPNDMERMNKDKRSMYHDAKRYYHESRTEQDLSSMRDRGKEYVSEAVDTMREMFMESDPELQKKIKEDIFRLYRELGGK